MKVMIDRTGLSAHCAEDLKLECGIDIRKISIESLNSYLYNKTLNSPSSTSQCVEIATNVFAKMRAEALG